jgi:hypothetical protein
VHSSFRSLASLRRSSPVTSLEHRLSEHSADDWKRVWRSARAV